MSVFIMIGSFNFHPFAFKSVSIAEGIDEVIVILSTYMIILMTDFVPVHLIEFREVVSFVFVSFLSMVTFYFLSMIIYPLLKLIYLYCAYFYNKHLFRKRMKKNIEAAALTILIQIDQVQQLREEYLLKKIMLQQRMEQGQDYKELFDECLVLKENFYKIQEIIEIND